MGKRNKDLAASYRAGFKDGLLMALERSRAHIVARGDTTLPGSPEKSLLYVLEAWFDSCIDGVRSDPGPSID